MRMTWFKAIPVLLALVAPVCAVHGAELTLADVLGGKAVPLTITFGELTAQWQQLTLKDFAGAPDSLAALAALMPEGRQKNPSFLYSQGQSVRCGKETFLIVYQFQAGEQSGNGTPAELTALPLSLFLLNMRTLNTIYDLQPVNPQQELARLAERKQEATRQQTLSRLRQVTTALRFYAQDHAGTLPPLADPAALKTTLQPYLAGEEALIDPLTGEPFIVNAGPGGKPLADVKEPAALAAVYEAKPGADGLRGVAFLDGRSVFVTEAEWTKIKQASGIP